MDMEKIGFLFTKGIQSGKSTIKAADREENTGTKYSNSIAA